MQQPSRQIDTRSLVVALAIIAAAAMVLLAMGRTPICKCGYITLWNGEVNSAENSQQLSDWYSPSHFIHGLLFYWGLAVLFGRLSMGTRLSLAVLVEAGWEILENTDFVINRYREATIALDYFGDSVLNSTSDIVMMILGFLFAMNAPVWLSVALGLGLEVLTGVLIRDNLTLNVIMLLHPFEAIKAWQMGAG